MSAPVVDLEMEGSRAAETLMEKHLNASLASKPGFTGSMSVPVPVASKPVEPLPREVTLTVTLKFHCYFLLVWKIFFKFIGWQGKATC